MLQPDSALASMPDGTLFEVVRQLPSSHSVCLLSSTCTSLRFRAQSTAVWLSWPHRSLTSAPEWHGAYHNWHVMKDSERAELLYGGIPPTWRPRMWLLLTDALRLKQSLDTGSTIPGHTYWDS